MVAQGGSIGRVRLQMIDQSIACLLAWKSDEKRLFGTLETLRLLLPRYSFDSEYIGPTVGKYRSGRRTATESVNPKHGT